LNWRQEIVHKHIYLHNYIYTDVGKNITSFGVGGNNNSNNMQIYNMHKVKHA